MWNTNTGEELKKLQEHKSWIYYITLSQDEKILYGYGYEKTIKALDTDTGKVVR